MAEWLHTPAHSRQEEPDGHRHHAAGVRRGRQRRHQAGHRPRAPRLPGRPRGHGVTAALQKRQRQPQQQGQRALCPRAEVVSKRDGKERSLKLSSARWDSAARAGSR